MELTIVAEARARREKAEKEAAEARANAPAPLIHPEDVRTCEGLVVNEKQLTAYKWIMIGIAEKICPGFQVVPEQKDALNQIFCYCMGIRTPQIDPTRGLWISGPVGTGKSTLLRVVKEFAYRMRTCGDEDYTFRITPAAKIAGEFSDKGYPAINTYVESRFQAIDDLGYEPRHLKFYGSQAEPLTYLLTMRYGQQREHDFTHVTTNLSMYEISERYGFRAADRIFEMFNVIDLPGRSFRRPAPSSTK